MRIALGDAEIHGIADLPRFALPLKLLLPDADLPVLEEARAVLDPDHLDYAAGELLLVVQTLALRIAGRTILVDTCVGEHKPRPVRPDWHQRRASGYLDRLAAAGIAPEEVDLVLCTHLHADHVGWNTRLEGGRWVPTFPRARYLVGRTELAHWQERPLANHGAYADSVVPILELGRMDVVDDGHELAPGATLTPLPGHTPGQMGVSLDLPQGRAILCGDAIHSPVQVLHPDWSSAFCTDPAGARATRRAILAEAVEHDTLIVPAHFRGCGCARIRRAGDRFTPVFTAD
jgi:glyoxylase-like metal-dependent hydrolase (beta-lactamase superfamily II)